MLHRAGHILGQISPLTELNASQMPVDCRGRGMDGFGIDWYIKLICSIATIMIIEQGKAGQGSILPHKFAVLGVVCGADAKAKIVYQSYCDSPTCLVVCRARAEHERTLRK